MLIVALIIVMAKDKIKPTIDNVLRKYDFFIFMKASKLRCWLPISQTASFLPRDNNVVIDYCGFYISLMR